MQPFTTLTGVAAPLDRANVDTDQIIPKQFLKRIERTGFGQFLFYDWRYEADGITPNPEFELNDPRLAGAAILVAARNFGSGSSRGTRAVGAGRLRLSLHHRAKLRRYFLQQLFSKWLAPDCAFGTTGRRAAGVLTKQSGCAVDD